MAEPVRPALDSLTIRATLSALVPVLVLIGGSAEQWQAAIAGVWAIGSLALALYGRVRVGDLRLPWQPRG